VLGKVADVGGDDAQSGYHPAGGRAGDKCSNKTEHRDEAAAPVEAEPAETTDAVEAGSAEAAPAEAGRGAEDELILSTGLIRNRADRLL
jgi:hypothetical protein